MLLKGDEGGLLPQSETWVEQMGTGHRAIEQDYRSEEG
jgi:hypothetical protein